ncbi:hypothetical protein C8R46DRAFT_1300024 [Mycena filopes]|nr:hypothetical protein C8R46DRAFT_1300024 [Mycena filopes]
MPRPRTVAETRVDNVTAYLTPALTLLNELNDAFGLSYVQPIIKTTQALLVGVQKVKRNKDECFQLVESIHQILYPIIQLHLKSETLGSGPLAPFEAIGEFTIQQDGNKIKQFFHQSEANKLLKECQAGLDHAIEVFKGEMGATVLTDVMRVQIEADHMHKELLELISALSDTEDTMSDRSSLVFYGMSNGSQKSSNSFSLLPSKPKIFHGRNSELQHILEVLAQEVPRIAILGAGGMGKHHSQELLFITVTHAADSRPDSFVLTTRQITMRGAERPGKVQWTRPFLQPLEPLSNEAAVQIFEDITDDSQLSDEKTQLLQFTGNMPLALDLMAHLVEYEGLSNVLLRWKTEKTSLLSIGYDRSSNMDTSIALSLSSPRITPQSRELLSLLSILPDGLSDVELVQSDLPIKDILSCKSRLIATSLAYKDNKGRLRSLVPIREHVQRFSPPPEALVQSRRKLFHKLFTLYQEYRDSRLSSVLAQITANLANLDEVLLWGLQPRSLDLAETIESTTSLNSFYGATRGGRTHLLNKIPIHLCGPRQRVLHIIECLRGFPGEFQSQKLLAEGISQFKDIQGDPMLEARLYLAAAESTGRSGHGLQFLEKALALSKSPGGDPTIQCICLIEFAWLRLRSGDYAAALALGRHTERLAYQTTNFRGASSALNVCTACLILLGDYPGAMMEIHKGKELLSLCGMTGGELYNRLVLSQAEIHLCKSEYAEARRIHATNLQESGLDESSSNHVLILLNIAQIDIVIGTRKELIYQMLDRASRTCISIHNLQGATLCDLLWGHLDLRQGNPLSARALFQRCLESRLGRDNEVELWCLEQLADITQWHTKFPDQSKWPLLYLCEAHKSKNKLGFAKALLFTADIFIEEDEATAQSLLSVALEDFTLMDVHRSRAQCMMRLGDLAHKKGKPTEAAGLWKSAQPLFERSLQAKDVLRIDERLSMVKQE